MSKQPHSSIFSLSALGALAALVVNPSPSYANGYWYSFKKYWTGFVGEQNGVVVTTVLLGALAIFIVTRGKWRK